MGVKRHTNAHYLPRDTGQVPLHFYWFRCVARFWNNPLTTKTTLLSNINEVDLLLAHRKGSWTFEVLPVLREIPAEVQVSAIMSRYKINMSEPLLREQTIREWRDLDQIHHMMHVSSKVMRTDHIHFSMHAYAIRESDRLVG